MEKENTIVIPVDNLLALCNILDKFEEFNKNTINFFSQGDCSELLKKLVKLTKDKSSGNIGKVENFYNENKKVIDAINMYSDVYIFFSISYCSGPKYTERLNYMYHYVLENRENLDKIIAILEKIKELEINKLQFNKEFDFKKNIYKINPSIRHNTSFIYLDNLEVIPSYESNDIKYSTTSSNYMIECKNDDGLYIKLFDEIKLNSLVFDVERFPKSLESKEIFRKIMSLKDEKKDDYNAIRSSVNLNINLEDIYELTEKLEKVIEGIDNVKTKDELRKYLSSVTESLSKMKETTDNYEKEIIKNSKYITSDVLEKEKTLYKERNNNSYID